MENVDTVLKIVQFNNQPWYTTQLEMSLSRKNRKFIFAIHPKIEWKANWFWSNGVVSFIEKECIFLSPIYYEYSRVRKLENN